MEAEPTRAAPPDTFARGVKLALGLHLMGLTLMGLGISLFMLLIGSFEGLVSTMMLTALNFGWAQLPYMIPAGLVLHARGERNTRNGLLVIAGVGFLITSGCWGTIAVGFLSS